VSVTVVETFYGLLALVALAFVGLVVTLRVAATVSSSARTSFDAIRVALGPRVVGLAFLVALLATIGSLYFSEVARFEPCRLCWYQRIAMYPLVIVLGIGAWRRDASVAIYGQALALIGAIIAGYHLALEWIPALDTGACGTGPACTIVWFRTFGFISLPMLALAAFLMIITLLSLRPAARLREPATDLEGARS
jgi:disulfide bond formation protein DsbB